MEAKSRAGMAISEALGSVRAKDFAVDGGPGHRDAAAPIDEVGDPRNGPENWRHGAR